jgi:hypothetical protein
MRDANARVQIALRSWMQGVLLLEGFTARVRFIIDAATGQPLIPVTGLSDDATLDACLAVPDDASDDVAGDRAMLYGELTPLDEQHPALARVEAFLGSLRGDQLRPTHFVVWSMRVSLAKIDDESVEGEDVCRASSLSHSPGAEARVCAVANRVPGALRDALGTSAEGIRAIGVDSWGIYARASFGLLFRPFDEPVNAEADAIHQLAAWGLS